MKLFFQNYKQSIKVSSHNPLEASLEQALEIFENLPEDDGSFLAIINEKGISVQFSKYNRFVWMIEVPAPERNGNLTMFLPRQRCKRLIKNIFEGLNPRKINGLTFQSFD